MYTPFRHFFIQIQTCWGQGLGLGLGLLSMMPGLTLPGVDGKEQERFPSSALTNFLKLREMLEVLEWSMKTDKK